MPVKTRTYTTLAERLKCRLEAVRSLVTGEVATLKVRIESLQAEVAKLEATAANHRADYERERDRADRLLTELLKATANTTGAMAAKLEGEIAAVRLAAEAGAGSSDVMVARASPDRPTIEVGEVRSISVNRGSASRMASSTSSRFGRNEEAKRADLSLDRCTGFDFRASTKTPPC
jgi:uncharacterized protein YigA (DUF484 family)